MTKQEYIDKGWEISDSFSLLDNKYYNVDWPNDDHICCFSPGQYCTTCGAMFCEDDEIAYR